MTLPRSSSGPRSEQRGGQDGQAASGPRKLREREEAAHSPGHLRIAQVVVGRPREDSTSGVDQTVFYLSSALAKVGHDVKIFSLSPKAPVPVTGVEVATYAPWRSPLRVPPGLEHDLREFRPDVVHLHSVYSPSITGVARWSRREGIPYVVRPAGGLSENAEKRRRLSKRVYKTLFELPMLQGAAFVHSVGDSESIEKFGVTSPIVTTSKGVDLNVPTETDRRWLRSRVHAPAEVKVLSFIGRLDPDHKGLDLLIDAFELVDDDNVLLLIAGPDHGGGRLALEKRASAARRGERVRFLGPVTGDDKRGLLAASDLFVHTSRWEGGVPYAVLEAAAAARPLLLTPGADRDRLVERSGGCIRVDSEPQDIARGIASFLAMGDESARAMGLRARALVEEEFRWEVTAAQFASAVARYAPGARP